jgi:hypothetical protein
MALRQVTNFGSKGFVAAREVLLRDSDLPAEPSVIPH